jgi:Ni/Fe-hydrogenase subunit HybB-like protein
MSSHEHPAPIEAPYFTRGTLVLVALALLGAAGYIYRLLYGLGAATNLNDQYPWGIWIAVDVASGVALAAGGFTTAALAVIFHRGRYHSVVRPALLTAMLGYTFVVVGLLADLGRYYNVWHPMLPSMWQGNSVLFEVGMCVAIYLAVLYIEFLPIVLERFRGRVRLPGLFAGLSGVVESFLEIAGRTLGRVTSVFIIAGVVLSCLHQSSLGTLLVIAPTKMHPLWYTPISPLLFLLSAIAVGFPMVIFESILAARSFRLKPERRVLSSIARYTPVLLGAYLALKIGDITLREAWPHVAVLSSESWFWIAEIVIGIVLPIVILSSHRMRRSLTGLFVGATLVIAGVLLNRINVFLVAYRPLYAEGRYYPSILELAVTVGLISALVLVYRAMVKVFPVITVSEKEARVEEDEHGRIRAIAPR